MAPGRFCSRFKTEADQRLVGSIVETLGSSRIESNQPGTPDRLKAYGLDPPAISVEFKLQNGTQHTLKTWQQGFHEHVRVRVD